MHADGLGRTSGRTGPTRLRGAGAGVLVQRGGVLVHLWYGSGHGVSGAGSGRTLAGGKVPAGEPATPSERSRLLSDGRQSMVFRPDSTVC